MDDNHHNGELRAKRRRFVEEYLIDLNATQAAIRAGYSAETAEQQGCRLLRNVKVQRAIAKRMAARSRRTNVTADRVLKEIARIAFASLSDFVEWGPDGVKLKPSAQLSADDRPAVVEVTQGKNGTLKIKLADKLRALEMAGRHLGMFNPLTADTLSAFLAGESGGTSPEFQINGFNGR
jgi:phage terminase small subunit